VKDKPQQPTSEDLPHVNLDDQLYANTYRESFNVNPSAEYRRSLGGGRKDAERSSQQERKTDNGVITRR
jgi:hypothetical protein